MLKKKPLIILGGGFLSACIEKFAIKNKIKYKVINRKDCDLSSINAVNYLRKSIPKLSPLIISAVVTRLKGNNYDNFLNNINIVRNVIDFNHTNNGHIIYMSSVDVYGALPAIPIKEDHPLAAQDYYSLSKIVSEYMIKEQLSKESGSKYTILRLNGLYGEIMSNNSVIFNMINTAFKKGYININNTNKIKRDYIYVNDVAKIINEAINRSIFGVFNVASGESKKISEIANIISREIKVPIKFINDTNNQRNNSLIFDNQKFSKYFKNFEYTPIEKGVVNFINFYKKSQ